MSKPKPIFVQVFISCKDLVISGEKKDTVCRALVHKPRQEPEVLGMTECFLDSKNPRYCKPLKLQFKFEKTQEIHLECHNVDSENKSYLLDLTGECEENKKTLIGSTMFRLGRVVASTTVNKKTPLISKGKNVGTAYYRFDTIAFTSSMTDTVRRKGIEKRIALSFRGQNLKKLDVIGLSDPYFVLSKQHSQHFKPEFVHKSEVIKLTLNPIWDRFSVRKKDFCNFDDKNELLLEVFDWDRITKDDFGGKVVFTLKDLKENNLRELKLCNKKGEVDESLGSVIVESFSEYNATEVNYEELSYVGKYLHNVLIGKEIDVSMVYAIDFTNSNLDYTEKKSLHYLHPKGKTMNPYEMVMSSVGSVLYSFDSDKQIPVLGFGACPYKAPRENEVSHCFALNGNDKNPNVRGFKEVMKTYKEAVKRVKFWGGTEFSGIMEFTAKYVTKVMKSEKGKRTFFVVLIITDGFIDNADIKKTQELLKKLVDKPLTVIVVGVGNSKWGVMQRLIEEDLSAGGKIEIDFLPMNDFDVVNKRKTREVLRKIPERMMKYYDLAKEEK